MRYKLHPASILPRVFQQPQAFTLIEDLLARVNE
jgi:hypothetical protein